MKILAIVVCLFLLAAIVGCASPPERFMTAEQDAYIYEQCQQGCAVMPAEVWEKIKKVLLGNGIGI